MIDPASRYGRRFFPMHELYLHVAGVYVELFVQLIVSKTKGLQRYTALLVQRKKPPWVHDPVLSGRIAALTLFAHFLSESDGRPICEVEWWNSGGWFGLGTEMEGAVLTWMVEMVGSPLLIECADLWLALMVDVGRKIA